MFGAPSDMAESEKNVASFGFLYYNDNVGRRLFGLRPATLDHISDTNEVKHLRKNCKAILWSQDVDPATLDDVMGYFGIER